MRLLERIIKKIIGKKEATYPPYNEYVQVDSTSVLLHGLKIRFDVGIESRKYVTIGKRGLINANFIFESEKGTVKIGDNVHIGGAMIICRSQIEIKNDVTMAWGITLYDHNSHSVDWEHRQHDNPQCYEDYHACNGNNVVHKDWSHVKTAPIVIESKVWIGFNVTILKGVTVGEGAVIGACSVVTKNVPAWSVVAGNPATVVKYLQKPE